MSCLFQSKRQEFRIKINKFCQENCLCYKHNSKRGICEHLVMYDGKSGGWKYECKKEIIP